MIKINQKAGRSAGQGLVEFALALPVLLLLLLGVIEFGRLLQAWMAVQNAARFGMRYAVTGEFDPQYCDDAANALGLQAADSYGGDTPDDCHVPDAYGPNARDLSDRLVDWARMPSARNSARGGAAGISMDESTAVSGDYLAFLTSHSLSDLGDPTHTSYFHVTLCSNRDRNEDGIPDFGKEEDTEPITCYDLLNNYFMDDAGGPGDRVRVTVTFEHPMIVPFINTIWPQVTLVAWREGIVEQFRASRVSGLGSRIADVPTNTPTSTVTLTPTPSNTPTETQIPPSPTNTQPPTLTPTLTSTPQPDCSLISASGARISGDDFEILVSNAYHEPAYLNFSRLEWPDYWNPVMYFDYFSFMNDRYHDTDSYSSPVSASAPSIGLPGESADWWEADFNWPTRIDSGGCFRGELTFDLAGLTCIVQDDICVTPTPTPTITSTPTVTPLRSPTMTATATVRFPPTNTYTPTSRPPAATPTSTLRPTNTRPPATPTATATICLTPPDLGGC